MRVAIVAAPLLLSGCLHVPAQVRQELEQQPPADNNFIPISKANEQPN